MNQSNNPLGERTKAARKALNDSFKQREQPRLLWASKEDGTAIRTRKGYRAKPAVQKRKATLTEAQDNAIGRAIRRRQNKRMRGWLPHAQR